MNRREFIWNTTGLLALGLGSLHAQPALPQYRAAIIGCTGRGNYGHELDLIFKDRANVSVVAVADPDEKGRAKAAQRSGALRQYADYREMLQREKPQLVSVAPRWTDQHFDMARAALEIGAHIYSEKPFAETLAQADELLALAKARNLKIAVAHQMRLGPAALAFKKALDEGLLGEIQQIRSWGKQDHRAGGEDMMVLGVHLFDMIRFLVGDALWCTAIVRQKGHEITRQDAHQGTESIGPVAGDEIEAQFGFAHRVHATFTSRAKLREQSGPWGFDVIGSKGAARLLMEHNPRIYLLKQGALKEEGRVDQWDRWNSIQPGFQTENSFAISNKRVVDDWLASIEQDREPICSGFAAMKAIEMVMAVYQAALSKTRISLPLDTRTHPLAG